MKAQTPKGSRPSRGIAQSMYRPKLLLYVMFPASHARNDRLREILNGFIRDAYTKDLKQSAAALTRRPQHLHTSTINTQSTYQKLY